MMDGSRANPRASAPHRLRQRSNCQCCFLPERSRRNKKKAAMDGRAASSYKSPTGLRHAQSMENVSWSSSPRKNNWPSADESYPNHASRNSLHRSDDFGQQQQGSNNNLNAASLQPFNNNPSLPSTQRDIVGNNLQFNPASQNYDWLDDENDQLAALLLYRDALKKNLTTQSKFGGGYPKMRHGRIGSQWRHIKQTNTYSGSNLMFIDGTVRLDDSIKFPIPRFGYPPMKRPQHKFSSSYNDLSFTSSNPTTQSLNTMTWSNADALHPRPSVSQHSSRYQRYAQNSGYDGNQSLQERVQPGLNQ